MSHPKRAIAVMKVLVVAGLLVGSANWTVGDVVPATTAKSNKQTSVDAAIQPEIASQIRRNTDVYTQKTVVQVPILWLLRRVLRFCKQVALQSTLR